MVKSSLGQTLTGASPDSRDLYETALHQMQCYIGDPVATIDAALATSSAFVMGHVLRAYLHLLGTEVSGLPLARESHCAAVQWPASEPERGHISVVGHLVEGQWHTAGAILEDLAIADPRDVLALQAGHIVDFYTGQTRMLRDRIGRALPAWHDGMPGYHAVIGMHAFGLEENGDYPQAERQGRRAVALEPRDGWGWHSVAHVMEMQGRQADGIAWLRSDPAAWSEDSFFAVHNWWHLALYHLDRGEIDAVLALFDGPVYGQRSTVVLDMIDASALLWRLQLRGIDVGDRWDALADNWLPLAEAGNYAFNDVHAMMAFVGAGRQAAMDRLLASQAIAVQGTADNAQFTREVGHPVTLAIQAFGEGDYQRCTNLLRPIRNIAYRFGGSHAQRDLLDLTLIEAAIRGGERALAVALTAERVAVKTQSPLARLLAERAAALGPVS
jgi:hypothetical protein